MNDSERKPNRGVVTAVFSPQGGAGCTFLATHLAFSSHKGRQLLVDLAVPFGCADLVLDVTPQKSWADLIPVAHELSGPLIERASTAVLERGELLAAPPLFTPQVMPAATLRAVLHTGRQHYQHIVLDLPGQLQEPTQTALQEADHIALVLRLDLPGLYRSQKALQLFEQWGVRPKVRLIGMETPHPKALHRGEIESLIGPLWAVLPWEPEATTKAINLGDPFKLKARRMEEALERLTSCWHQKAALPEPNKRPGNRFNLLLKRASTPGVQA